MICTTLPSLPISETDTLIEPKVRSFSVRARWLHIEDCRLDASFHADEVLAARRAIVDSGVEVKLLGKCVAEVFMPALTLKIPFGDKHSGFPYLTQSELFMFRPLARKFVITRKLDNPERWFVKAGWLVISQSGTVGIVGMVTKHLERFVISPNPIRIVPRDDLPAGYLYAFLSARLGQVLIKGSQYRKTVDHILPQHVSSLPVPLLPAEKRQAIHEQIMKAYQLRNEANNILDQADELLYAELGLPRFDESQVSYLGGVKRPKAFAVKVSELDERLDASFHLPIAKAAVQQLSKGKYPLVQLGDVAERIFIPPRFKRIYVNPEHGVPFLQGSHIPLMKPYDLKYLSHRANERYINECLIHTGWILLTRSGTVGRLILVPSVLEGWAASEHCLRIIANSEQVHPGYLTAFLMTPYGQHQLTSKIYGGVVDELTEDDTAVIWLPDAPMEIQQRIGTLVVQAFEKKEEANRVEEQAISTLEKAILVGRA
jgi:type I restriction enzyme S subunit